MKITIHNWRKSAELIRCSHDAETNGVSCAGRICLIGAAGCKKGTLLDSTYAVADAIRLAKLKLDGGYSLINRGDELANKDIPENRIYDDEVVEEVRMLLSTLLECETDD